jgi:hypothetical protein
VASPSTESFGRNQAEARSRVEHGWPGRPRPVGAGQPQPGRAGVGRGATGVASLGPGGVVRGEAGPGVARATV